MWKVFIVPAILAGIGAFLYFSGILDAIDFALQGHPGVPSCQSTRGQTDAKKAINNSSAAKILDITVVTLIKIKTTWSDADTVDCVATAVFSNATMATVSFNFIKKSHISNGLYIVQTSLDPSSFKPL